MIITSHYFTTVYHKLCKQHVMSVTVNYLLAVNIHNLSYLSATHLGLQGKGNKQCFVVISGSCCSNEESIRKARDFIELTVLCS